MSRKIVIGRVVYSRKPRPFNFKAVRRVYKNWLVDGDVSNDTHLDEFVELFALYYFAIMQSKGYIDQSGRVESAFRQLAGLVGIKGEVVVEAAQTMGINYGVALQLAYE